MKHLTFRGNEYFRIFQMASLSRAVMCENAQSLRYVCCCLSFRLSCSIKWSKKGLSQNVRPDWTRAAKTRSTLDLICASDNSNLRWKSQIQSESNIELEYFISMVSSYKSQLCSEQVISFDMNKAEVKPSGSTTFSTLVFFSFFFFFWYFRFQDSISDSHTCILSILILFVFFLSIISI